MRIFTSLTELVHIFIYIYQEYICICHRASQLLSGKESTCQGRRCRSVDSIPGSGRSPGVGNGNQFQDSCLGNSMVRGAWQATVHGVAKSQTQLSTCICHIHMRHIYKTH